MAEPQTRRVFFALWPEVATRSALDGLASLAASNCGGRRMRRDTLHLTLVFVGAVTPAQMASLGAAASRVHVAPFDFVLDRLGYWRHNHIVWAGCDTVPPGLLRLQSELSRSLMVEGFPVAERSYFPHVTLVRNACCGELPSLRPQVAWRALEFSLVESQLSADRARYCVLNRWPLVGR